MKLPKFQINKSTTAVILGVIAIVLLLLQNCHQKRINDMRSAWANDTVRLNKLATQKDSITRYEMEQKIGTYKDAAIVAGDEAKKYKSILAVVKAKVGAGKTNIVAEYTKPLPNTPEIPDSSNLQNISEYDSLLSYMQMNTIPVGTTFAYNDKWFYIGGTLGAENILIDSTGFYPGTMKVIIGNKKSGFLKRSQPTISLMFENPNMYAHTANNIIVQDKRKPKRGLWLFSGIAAGLVGGLLAK